MERKKLYLSPLLKNGNSRITFRIETEDGEVLSTLSKYCSEVEYNARGKFCKNSVNEDILLVGNDVKKLV